MSYKIVIQNISRIKKIPTNNLIKTWINAALNKYINHAEITVRIVDEDESGHLNQQYRHKQGPTNILSFPYNPHDSAHKQLATKNENIINTESSSNKNNTLVGDLVICAPIVLSEATSQHKSIESHWAHLIIHGSLHLLGYDHINDQQAHIMENLEISILHSLGFNNPYIYRENSSSEHINEI